MSAPKAKTHKETVNFTGFPGYYGSLSSQDGFGGLNYSGLGEYLNATYWENVVTFWCDTGYQNVAAAAGASGVGYVYEYATFSSAGKTKFDLKSFIAASSWSANQEWQLTTNKGSMDFYTTDAPGTTAQTIKPGKIGKGITTFTISMVTLGSGGNTCSYGTPVEGYQMAIDGIKLVWHGKIPSGLHNNTHQAAHQHHAPAAALMAHQASHVAASQHQGAAHHTDGGYHTQMLSLHHDSGGLTSQFSLPQVEHLA